MRALAVLPGVASGYVIYILPQYLLYGVLAMSLALLWGFGGILSFGQTAFFGIGGYLYGIYTLNVLGSGATLGC